MQQSVLWTLAVPSSCFLIELVLATSSPTPSTTPVLLLSSIVALAVFVGDDSLKFFDPIGVARGAATNDVNAFNDDDGEGGLQFFEDGTIAGAAAGAVFPGGDGGFQFLGAP